MKQLINKWISIYDPLKIVGLWGIFFGFFMLLGGGFFFRPLLFVLSGGYFRMILGGYFSQRFDKIHAGGALDQPTIGKFLFWFIVFSTAAVIISILIRISCDFSKKSVYWLFTIPFLFAMLSVLSFLLVPGTMLAHYIYDMGSTPRRIQGMVFVVACELVWFLLAYLLLRRWKKAKEEMPEVAP